MDHFTEKTKLFLNNPNDQYSDSEHKSYVYALIDPKDNKIFYIGKGCGDRVFEHEKEASNSSDLEKEIENKKLARINEIKSRNNDNEVIRIIIHYGMTSNEALAAEAALISAFQQQGYELTNIVSGHNGDEALTVEEFDRVHGATEYNDDDINFDYIIIKTKESTIKSRNTDTYSDKLYEAARKAWTLSIDIKNREIRYVLATVTGLVKEVYEVNKWDRSPEGERKVEFDGHVAPDAIRNQVINKLIPAEYRKQGNASSSLYKKQKS